MNPASKTYYLKFIYSEKAINFSKISTVDLSYVVPVKSTAEISQNFAAFSEYMNFTLNLYCAILLPLWSETTTKNGGRRKCFLVQYFYRPWDTFMEFVSKQKYVSKVQVFQKDHKNLKKSPICFDATE